MEDLPEIRPHYATEAQRYKYTPYKRDEYSNVRYWAVPGMEGYEHILGGLEKMERQVLFLQMPKIITAWIN